MTEFVNKIDRIGFKIDFIVVEKWMPYEVIIALVFFSCIIYKDVIVPHNGGIIILFCFGQYVVSIMIILCSSYIVLTYKKCDYCIIIFFFMHYIQRFDSST